jgi:hypothetical protein
MALVVPTCGETKLLSWALTTATQPDCHLHLYSNNHTPGASDTAANYTECTFTGYTAHTLARATWGTPTIVSGSAQSTYATQSWSATSSQTVYGYYTTADDDNSLVWAELFASPRSLVSGDVLNVVPQMALTTA